MSLHAARAAEHAKYRRVYATGRYRMKRARRQDAAADLAALPCRGSFLDVGCGYGDVLDEATALGFATVMGVEVTPSLIDGERVVYAEAHDLPFEDGAFEVVAMIDVIEHLLPGDDEAACRELRRVASRHILITANNQPSIHAGEDLHINKRSYDQWHELFQDWFGGTVRRLTDGRRDQGPFASAAWRVDL